MNEHLEELLPFYALDALTPEEKTAVETYLVQNPAAQARLAEYMEATDVLPLAADPIVPSPHIKESLMARVAVDKAPAARTMIEKVGFEAEQLSFAGWLRQLFAGRGVMPAFTLLAFLGLIILGTFNFTLSQQISDLRVKNALLEEALLEQETLIALVGDDESRIFPILGTEFQPTANGRLVADAVSGRGVLVVSDLAILPASETYQFWLIGDEGAVSAGIFQVNEFGRGLLEVENAGSVPYNAIGVSVEPSEGSEQPTGNIVMLAEL